MSKLYDNFVNLKGSNKDKLYLFKSGIFFIALNEDATKLSEIFGFKITNLNDTVIKCGFPAKRIEYYSSLLDKMNIDFDLIDSGSKKIENHLEYISNLNFNSIIDKLVKIDFDNITCKEAFDILYDLSLKCKEILNSGGNQIF